MRHLAGLIVTVVLFVGLARAQANQYPDATRYGVQAMETGTPVTSGVAGSIRSETNSLTISTNSCGLQPNGVCFAGGYGISVYGAGTASGLGMPGTPTVTPSNNRTLPGTGDDVNSLGGSSTYNYIIVAQSIGGGLSAPSSVGSTRTGVSSLGSVSTTISTLSRSANIVTVTTTANSGINAGTMVIINGASDPTFNGFYQADSGSGNASFTYTQGLSTVNGATTSATGGTVYYFADNVVRWTASSGSPFRYWICSDRASPGTYHVIGVSKPNNPSGSAFTDGTLYWEDYGATMRGGFTALSPNVSDAICTGSGTPNTLTTTVTSVSGTTLTLAANATNSVTNGSVRFDDAAQIKAALTSTRGRLNFLYPTLSGGSYVVNSILDLHAVGFVAFSGAGLSLFDTLVLSEINWNGIIYPGGTSADQFQFESLPGIACNAVPCLYNVNGGSGRIQNLRLGLSSNNSIGILSDGGGGSPGVTFERLNFAMGSHPYMSEGLELRGASDSSSSGACNLMREVLFLGSQFPVGQTATPIYYGNRGGCATVESSFLSGAGAMIRYDTPGGSITQEWGYRQSGYMPVVTVTAIKESGGIIGAKLEIKNFVQDTDALCLVSDLPSQARLSIGVIIKTGSLPSAGQNQVCGDPLTMLHVDASPSSQTGQNTNINGLVSEGAEILESGATPGTGIGMQMQRPAAPTASVASGGSLALGSYTYEIVAYDTNGNTTTPSLLSKACTTNRGNQTCNLKWSLVPGQVATTICRNNACAVIGAGFKMTGVTFSDNGRFFPSGSPPATNQAIASGDTGRGLTTHQIELVGDGFRGTLSPSFTADRTMTAPDGDSNLMVVGTLTTTSNTSDNLTLQGVTSSSHCAFSAANVSAAKNITLSYISSVSSNSVTLAHAATAGMIYNFICSKN